MRHRFVYPRECPPIEKMEKYGMEGFWLMYEKTPVGPYKTRGAAKSAHKRTVKWERGE